MKCIKIFRMLVIALTLALLVSAIPSAPSLALGEVIVLAPNQGGVGQQIIISGNGFFASETVSRGVNIIFGRDYPGATINYDLDTYEEVKIAGLDSDGTFSTTFDVPETLTGGIVDEDVSSGTYYVYLTYYYPGPPAVSHTIILDITVFTVVSVGEIILDSIEGMVGTEVTVSGTGFATSKSVTISFDGVGVGTSQTDSVGSFTRATFTVPASYRGNHTVEAKDASNNSATATFTTRQSIAMTPISGAAGDAIAISGTGFAARTSVTISFDNIVVVTVATNSVGSFTAIFNVPALAAGNYNVGVVDVSGNSATVVFTIGAAGVSLIPTNGYVGDEVAVSGTGFIANQPITITFYNETVKTASTDASGSFSAAFTVPSLAAGNYQVKISDGVTTKEADFSISIYTSASIGPETSAASPGHVGTGLTVTGVGFIAGRTVTVTYDGNPVATTPQLVAVNTDGSFSATFNVPVSNSGEHSVIATDGTNTKQFTFVMESTPPPTPVPLKPEMGIKAEAEVYLDWDDVTDPSGVTYTLQIATEENFSEDSIVLEKTGLVKSEYIITEEEKLESVSKESPYYWRVRAIDSAANKSQWSGTGSFYVGFVWALSQRTIYVLFGIGALLLAVFGFWLGRKTAYY